MGSEVCPKCKVGVEAVTPFAWKGDGVETRFLCGSCESNSGFAQSDRCRIAALTEASDNWRKMYRELYCEIWCAAEEEFDETAMTDGLAHGDTLKELVKMIRAEISRKETT